MILQICDKHFKITAFGFEVSEKGSVRSMDTVTKNACYHQINLRREGLVPVDPSCPSHLVNLSVKE